MSNVFKEGYDSYFTPSNSSRGGTCIYVKNAFDSIERTDLNVQHDDFESSWIEIKNKRSKNIICGCIYRHPRYNLTDFIAYMDKCLHILLKENKEFYISGVFNTNLLRLEINTSHQEFYNLMASFGFLPQILDPTRVTESSATIINNIYTNCHEYNHLSL